MNLPRRPKGSLVRVPFLGVQLSAWLKKPWYSYNLQLGLGVSTFYHHGYDYLSSLSTQVPMSHMGLIILRVAQHLGSCTNHKARRGLLLHKLHVLTELMSCIMEPIKSCLNLSPPSSAMFPDACAECHLGRKERKQDRHTVNPNSRTCGTQ